MKNTITYLCLLLLISGAGQCQNVLLEAKLAVTLPSPAWPDFTREIQGGRLIYTSKPNPIFDKAGQNITPNISFILEQIPDALDLKTFSMELQRELSKDQPDGLHNLRVLKTYRAGGRDAVIRQKNMVGYQLNYLDKDSVAHTVYVVYIVHNSVGVQAIFDSTTEVFKQCGSEFLRTIHSITTLP